MSQNYEIPAQISELSKAELDEQERIAGILRDTGLIQLPVDHGHEQLRDVKLKLDSLINSLEGIVEGILQKTQDRFIAAYSRFLVEVKHELSKIQKEYDIEILKKQSNSEIMALYRTLEWLKHECMKLNEENKAKAKTITKLKAEISELNIYGKGYEKGIKDIKKEMLVLRFVNKTKTSLLRKYADRLEGANKYIDAADLRPQLRLYLQKDYCKSGQYLADNMYLKNQLKQLSDQYSLLNTAQLCDFFIQKLEVMDREKATKASKQADEIRRTRQKVAFLSTTMEMHRNNRSHIPGVIHSLFEEHFMTTDKSIERDLNEPKPSRPASHARDIFLTAEREKEHHFERFFVKDFTVEYYAGLNDEQRKELFMKLVSNKKLIFGFREYLIRKLDPLDASCRDMARVSRHKDYKSSRLDRSGGDSSNFDGYDRERALSSSRAGQEKATDSIENRSMDTRRRTLTLTAPTYMKKEMSIHSQGLKAPKSKLAMTDITFEGQSRAPGTANLKAQSQLQADVLKKRKLLRYIVKHTGGSSLLSHAE